MAKVRGPQHLVETENRSGFLCHPAAKMGRFLMTWDDEASSASY